MPLEKGGRADKHGNRYEIKCIIYEMLKVINEINYSVTIEALGDDEIGTDILIINNEEIKEHQECKSRNSSKDFWSFSELKSKNIISSWKNQLDRPGYRKVSLLSPLACTFIVDLNSRAVNTSENADNFYNFQIMKSGKEFIKLLICDNVIAMPKKEIEKNWTLANDISKLIMSLYDQTADNRISEKCLALWDSMFEKQIGSVREISKLLSER